MAFGNPAISFRWSSFNAVKWSALSNSARALSRSPRRSLYALVAIVLNPDDKLFPRHGRDRNLKDWLLCLRRALFALCGCGDFAPYLPERLFSLLFRFCRVLR